MQTRVCSYNKHSLAVVCKFSAFNVCSNPLQNQNEVFFKSICRSRDAFADAATKLPSNRVAVDP